MVTIVTICDMKNHIHSELIDRFGGTGIVAQLCEVTSQAVSKWRREGIPSARLKYLRVIRPDVFKKQDKSEYDGVERRKGDRRMRDRRDC